MEISWILILGCRFGPSGALIFMPMDYMVGWIRKISSFLLIRWVFYNKLTLLFLVTCDDLYRPFCGRIDRRRIQLLSSDMPYLWLLSPSHSHPIWIILLSNIRSESWRRHLLLRDEAKVLAPPCSAYSCRFSSATSTHAHRVLPLFLFHNMLSW
jgi:hypothetical protein